MTNSIDPILCPKCHSAIPEDAPDGLCPKCALQAAATVSLVTAGGRQTPPPTLEEIAPHFPELEILELLGAGGMGAVYKARQPQLDRLVALKILSRDLSSDPAFVERFNREAKVLARLSHPNIVGVHDFGTAGPYCYLTMELVDGVNLRQAMQAGRFAPSEALAMVEYLCSALKFAHEEGILHRDIKPENVLIDAKGRVKIADFGIAKLVGEQEQADVTLTLQGSVLGSPQYMAPEQIETPGDVDQRADIYSLGVVLYELLTGELPIGRFPLPSEKAEMDGRIDEIVMRTLEKEREARFQSAEEVQTSVGALADSAPVLRGSEGQGGDRSTARFSMASAILTGISLILGVAFIWAFLSNMGAPVAGDAAEVAQDLSSRLPRMILGILHACSFGVTGLLGFILGGKALGDIRASGGRKRGLGSACFGTLAWPVLFLFMLTGLSMNFVPVSGPGTVMAQLPIPLLLVSAILAGVILVRGVVRWAGGVDDGKGGRSHPGFGWALAGSVMMASFWPVVVAVIVSLMEGDQEPPIRVHEPNTTSQSSTVNSDEAIWRTGSPSVVLPFALKPGQTAGIKVVHRNVDGMIWTSDLGEVTYRPEAPKSRPVLKVGTELYGTLHRMVIIRSGLNGHRVRSLEDLRGYEFNEDLPDELRFDTPGLHEFQLAGSTETEQGRSKGALILEVVVSE